MVKELHLYSSTSQASVVSRVSEIQRPQKPGPLLRLLQFSLFPLLQTVLDILLPGALHTNESHFVKQPGWNHQR